MLSLMIVSRDEYWVP